MLKITLFQVFFLSIYSGELIDRKYHDQFLWGGAGDGLLESSTAPVLYPTNIFKILKSGCKLEKLRINSKDHFDPCLALYLVIAWRISYLTMLGRAHPNVDSEQVFEAIEWQTAYIILHKKKNHPKNLLH